MNPDHQEFDRKIRERMTQFTPDVSAGLWAKIEAGLPDEISGTVAPPVSRRPSPWWWAAAAILAVSLLSYWFTRPVEVIYLQGKTAAPADVSLPQTTVHDTKPPVAETVGNTSRPIRTARRIPRKTTPARTMPATAEPVAETQVTEPAVRQPPVAIETANVAPVALVESTVADTVTRHPAEVPGVQPPVVLDNTEEEMLASTAPPNPFGVSRLLNFVIGTVDRREEKAVTFSSDSEGSLKVEFNLAGNRRRK